MLKEIVNAINSHVSLRMTIDINEEKEITMMLRLSPKVEDNSLSKIPPVIITGSVEEVEADLLKFIKSPSVNKISETAIGVSEFEKAAKKAAEENKVVEANKKKIKDLIDKGDKKLEKEDVKGCQTIIKKIEVIPGADKNKKFKEFLKKVDDLVAIKSQATIFDDSNNDGNLDPDVKASGSQSRAIKYGIGTEQFDQERKETIEQERIDKLNQNGNTELTEEF